MSLLQSVAGCLEAKIGGAGLSQASLDASLAKLEPRLAALREAYAASTLPFLRVPEWRDDIAAASHALTRLTHGARTLVFFGTGGSSLGGQTLAQLGGWGIPGDDKHGSEARPRTRFYDNLDARTLELALAGLDLKTTRFVVISKSGGTPETLVQILTAIDAVRKAGLAERIPELFLAVTEPNMAGIDQRAPRPLREFRHPGARPRSEYRRPVLRADQCRASACARPRPRCRGAARGRGLGRRRHACGEAGRGFRACGRCRSSRRARQGARHSGECHAPL